MRKTTKIQHYKVIIEKGEDGYFIARVPAIPGCVTQAKTHEALVNRVQEAIQLCVEVAEKDDDYNRKKNFFSYEPTFIGIEDVAVRV